MRQVGLPLNSALVANSCSVHLHEAGAARGSRASGIRVHDHYADSQSTSRGAEQQRGPSPALPVTRYSQDEAAVEAQVTSTTTERSTWLAGEAGGDSGLVGGGLGGMFDDEKPLGDSN